MLENRHNEVLQTRRLNWLGYVSPKREGENPNAAVEFVKAASWFFHQALFVLRSAKSLKNDL